MLGGKASGYLAVGGSEGFGQGADDAWLLRLDENGEHMWSVVHGGPADDDPTAFVQLNDGGFLVAGVTFGYTAVKSDAFLMRTDNNGKVLWFRLYGSIGKDEPVAIEAMGSGFLVSGTTTGQNAGHEDGFALRVDGDGNTKWLRTYGGAGNDAVQGMMLDQGGGFVLTGRTSSSGQGGADAWWVKGGGGDGASGCAGGLVNPPWQASKSMTPTTLAFTPVLLAPSLSPSFKSITSEVAAGAKSGTVCPCVIP